MLKRLRKKIVLINMAFVGVVLIAVFAAVCITSYQSLKSDIYHSLQLATEQRGEKPEPPLADGKKDNFPKQNLIAVCTVIVDDNGVIKQFSQNNAFLSENLLSKAALAAFEATAENGSLTDYSLFYQKRSFFGGTKIAFADSEYLYSSLRQLIFTSLLIGGCSMIAIFFISLFLSKLAVRPVEKAWKQQQQFVADASHELKTPLTVILANNNILLSHINDTIANQKKWLDSTGEEAEHMRKLIDNMLFLAQGDAGQLPVIQTPVNFSELVWSVLLQFEPIAYEKQIELDSDIQPELYIKGDVTQLKQLIHIFLDNGCKYAGQHGQVFLRLFSQQNNVLLCVRNTGAVILKEELPHIFERFYRSDKARVREGGFGLGLAIAKSITENHAGTISAESAPETGTKFTVCFTRVLPEKEKK